MTSLIDKRNAHVNGPSYRMINSKDKLTKKVKILKK